MDYHIAEGHGPPTIFLTLSCAENWWPDLIKLLCQLERYAKNMEVVKSMENNNYSIITKTSKKYPGVVNEFFMERTKIFIETVLEQGLQIDYYWSRIEFTPG